MSCQILWIFTLRGTWSDRTLTEEGTTSGNYMLIVHSVVCYMCFSSCKPDLDVTKDLQTTAGLFLLFESIRRVKCSTGSQCREVWDLKVPWAELCMDETNNRHTNFTRLTLDVWHRPVFANAASIWFQSSISGLHTSWKRQILWVFDLISIWKSMKCSQIVRLSSSADEKIKILL